MTIENISFHIPDAVVRGEEDMIAHWSYIISSNIDTDRPIFLKCIILT